MEDKIENSNENDIPIENIFGCLFVIMSILCLMLIMAWKDNIDKKEHEKRIFNTSVQCLTLAEGQDHACLGLKKYDSSYDKDHELYSMKLNGSQCSVSCQCFFDNDKMSCKLSHIILNKVKEVK